jgi:tetratricopeptide (TPR) repeat protein
LKHLVLITLSLVNIIGCTPVPVSPISVTESLTVQPTEDVDASSTSTQTTSVSTKCPELNNSLVPDFTALFDKDRRYDSSNDRDIVQPILDFLNKGGSPKLVVTVFNKEFDEGRSESLQKDLTNDDIPELIVSDYLLHVFGCKNRIYDLLLKVDPGNWVIEYSDLRLIDDLNVNGIPDLIVSEWVGDINLYVPETYRIMEWDGSIFKDLIIQPEFESRYGAGGANDGQVWIDGLWSYTETAVKQMEISDVDGNGTKEFILRGGLPGHPDTQRHGPWRGETNIYMWNGDGFVIYSVEPAPPVYRFQAVQDADYAFFDGEYDKAVELYQEVISNDNLDWWSTDKYLHINRTFDAMLSGSVTPTPLPPDDSEYNYLSAYARYRIMLIYVKHGRLPEAKEIYDNLQEQYRRGKEGHVIAELATVFWSVYQYSNNLSSSCSKAIDFTNENVFEIFNYVNSVKTDESYDWTYHGWQKTHNYTVNDICPF